MLVQRVKNIDFTEAGSCYKIDFDKQESAVCGTVSLELKLSCLLRVDYMCMIGIGSQ